jgi:hypothetical protein
LRQIAVDNQSVDRGWDELPRKTTVVASLNPTARIMFARRIRCGSTRLTPGPGRGLIGITFAPGKHDRHATGGPWAASRVDRCKAHRSRQTTLWGFPCCVRFPCAHAAATTPVQQLGVVLARLAQPYQPSPKGLSGRPAHRPFRGLLSVHSRCGPHTRAVTYRDLLHRRLQPFRYLHDCSGCFRLERLAGWVLHPLESAALSRRTHGFNFHWASQGLQ